MATALTQHLVSLVSHVAVRVGKALVRGELLAVPIQRQTRTVHYGPQSLHGRNFTSWVRLTHVAHGDVRTLQQTATNLNTANNATSEVMSEPGNRQQHTSILRTMPPARWCQNLATDSNKHKCCQQCHQQGDVRTWQQTLILPTMPPARWC